MIRHVLDQQLRLASAPKVLLITRRASINRHAFLLPHHIFKCITHTLKPLAGGGALNLCVVLVMPGLGSKHATELTFLATTEGNDQRQVHIAKPLASLLLCFTV